MFGTRALFFPCSGPNSLKIGIGLLCSGCTVSGQDSVCDLKLVVWFPRFVCVAFIRTKLSVTVKDLTWSLLLRFGYQNAEKSF